jgi:hypothetical protein
VTAFQRDIAAARQVSLPKRAQLAWETAEAFLARDHAWLIAICCAAILQAALIVTHRPWLDEWQALLIAHQTPSLANMFEQLHYEGHPQLWYMILRGVSAVLPLAWVFPATNLALAALTWWAILGRAPFGRLERLLLVLNEILLFEMLGVARSPALGVALLFTALALWRSRSAWFVIALLPLCDFFFGVIACALILVRLRDRQDQPFAYGGAALFAAFSLVAAWGAAPAPNIVTDPARGWVAGPFEVVRELGTLLVPWETSTYDNPAPILIGLLLGPAFLLLCAHALREDRLARWLSFGFVGLLMLFGSAIYPIYLRHTALAAVLLVALVWIAAMKKSHPGILFRAWLAVAAICGLATATTNFVVPFDTAAEAATVIRAQNLDRKIWFSYPAFRSVALTGESGVAFGNLERQCAVQFMRWDFRSGIGTRMQFLALLNATEARYGSFYIATQLPLPATIAQPLAQIPAGYDGVSYTLWKVGNGPAADGELPLCISGLRPLTAAVQG